MSVSALLYSHHAVPRPSGLHDQQHARHKHTYTYTHVDKHADTHSYTSLKKEMVSVRIDI